MRSRASHYGSKRSKKVGLPPGSLVYVGDKVNGHAATKITAIQYNSSSMTEIVVAQPEDLLPLLSAQTVTWINVDSIHNAELLAKFGQLFNLHPLLLEDILNTEQRPKSDELDGVIYVILKMFDFNMQQQHIVTEQVSLVIGSNFLITFLEEVGNEFDPIRERLRANGQRLRGSNSGYLAYSILDTLVDRYFMMLEKLGLALEEKEEKLVTGQPSNLLKDLHHLKREMIFLRKNIWPVREVVANLQRSEARLMDDQTRMYLRDVYEHTIQAMDTLDTYRDLLGGIQDLYLSILSNRMNEVMKVLTVISTIFIPLTFIVGVYGMNFEYLPELKVRWAYPAVWCVMVAIASGLIIFFKRKKWI